MRGPGAFGATKSVSRPGAMSVLFDKFGRICETYPKASALSLDVNSDPEQATDLPGGRILDTNYHHDFAGQGNENAIVAKFAYQVVSKLARRNGIEAGAPEEQLLSMMVSLARSGDPRLLDMLYAEMKRMRISAETVVDVYLPSAVNRLGNAWHDGELDILQATIAMSRMQALLRELGRAWVADQSHHAIHGRVLLAMPEQEQHTLGAILMAHQLRRLGVSVRVEFLISPPHLTAEIEKEDFDALFISVANLSSLGPCASLVKATRASARPGLPVVVGGALVAKGSGPMTAEEAMSRTGADLVTSDLGEALGRCGLLASSIAAE